MGLADARSYFGWTDRIGALQQFGSRRPSGMGSGTRFRPVGGRGLRYSYLLRAHAGGSVAITLQRQRATVRNSPLGPDQLALHHDRCGRFDARLSLVDFQFGDEFSVLLRKSSRGIPAHQPIVTQPVMAT